MIDNVEITPKLIFLYVVFLASLISCLLFIRFVISTTLPDLSGILVSLISLVLSFVIIIGAGYVYIWQKLY